MTEAADRLELVVEQLDCADEAVQIEHALAGRPGISQVKTSVAARKVFVTYEPHRIGPAAIRGAIEALGMTVRDGRGPAARRRAPVPDLLGRLFVAAVAVVALVGILGERPGLIETVAEWIPPWLALAAVLVGGFPIFRNVVRALRNRRFARGGLSPPSEARCRFLEGRHPAHAHH